MIAINGQSLLDNTLEEVEGILLSLPHEGVLLEVIRPDSTEPLNKLLASIVNDSNAPSYSPG